MTFRILPPDIHVAVSAINRRTPILGCERQFVPSVVIGEISFDADLDDNHRQLHGKLLKKFLQANREIIQSAFAKSTGLLAREVNQVWIRSRQDPRRVAKIVALSKFGLGDVDSV